MKRCKRCIMPETVPGVSFNGHGHCTYCQDYTPPPYLGEHELINIVNQAKMKACEFDCIVPVSGGRDSTYILYAAKNIYALKVLAVHYDNEFTTTSALRNLERACMILGVPLLQFRSKRDIAHKIVKYNLRSSTEFGQFRECAACTYGYRSIVFRAAKQHRVPMIFWGESQQEATADMESNAFAQIRRHKIKYVKLLKPDFYIAEYYRLLQRIEFYVSWQNILNRKFEPIYHNSRTREIRIFDYIAWDRKKIKATITNELGWEKPGDLASTWKTDCLLIPLTNFYYIKLFGCTKLCFGYCKMINSGQMERSEALRQEEKYLSNYSNGIRQLLEKNIRLPKRKADRILRFRKIGDISL